MTKEMTKDEMVAEFKRIKELQKERNQRSKEKQKEKGLKTYSALLKESEVKMILESYEHSSFQSFLNEVIVSYLNALKAREVKTNGDV